MNDKMTSHSPSGVLTQPSKIHFAGSSDRTSRLVSYCALLMSLLTFVFGNNIASRLGRSFPSPQDNKTIFEGIIGLVNVALAVLVLVDSWVLRPVKTTEDKSPSALSFKQLLLGWRLLWFTWILFYGCLSALWLYGISDSAVWHVSTALNMINGFFFYYMFFVLDQPSVPSESEPNRAKKFRQNIYVTVVLGIIIFIVSIFLRGRPVGAGGEGILVEKLAPAYIAVGMAFFFGRLDSHYLRAHRVLLAPLYLYAVIQLFWGESTLSREFNPERVTILGLALILKFVIFITVSKWIIDGRFRNYFVVAKEGLDTSVLTSAAAKH